MSGAREETRTGASGYQHPARWASVGEFVTYCETAPRDGHPADEARENPASAQWDLDAGYDGAVKLARVGWPEGRERLDAAATGATPTALAPAPIAALDVAGAFPIAAAAASGDPASMYCLASDYGRTPIVRLVVDTVAPFSVDANQLANLGGAYVALVDRLETMGARVEISVALTIDEHGSGGKPPSHFQISVKQAEEPMDLDRVAVAVAHPAFFRRLGFRLIERHPWTKNVGGGYGQAGAAPIRLEDYTGRRRTRGGLDADQVYLPPVASYKRGALTDPARAAAAVTRVAVPLIAEGSPDIPPAGVLFEAMGMAAE